MSYKPQVVFDMDGCLSKFAEGAFAMHGVKPPPPAEMPWEIAALCGFKDISDPGFWRPLSNVEFWAGLEPHEDGLILASGLGHLAAGGVIDLAICTSSAVPGSMDGKQQWLDRYLPWIKRRMFVVGGKGQAAGPNKLLLDDHDPNLADWSAHSGLSLTVPRPWNKARGQTTDGYSFDPLKLHHKVLAAVEKLARECPACGMTGTY